MERPSPVTVQLNGTAGLLLLRLMEQLGTEDGGSVLSRALGLMEMALRQKREGKELCFVDPTSGQRSEVVF